MKNRIEEQPNSSINFKELRQNVLLHVGRADLVRIIAGQDIKEQIRFSLLHINKDILPESIDIRDITPHVAYTLDMSPAELQPTEIQMVKYLPPTNKLILISRTVRRLETLDESYFATKSIFFRLPENQQTERVLREMNPAEWVDYGPRIVEELEKAVKEAQEAKIK